MKHVQRRMLTKNRLNRTDREIRYFETRTQQLALETASRNFQNCKRKKEEEARGTNARPRQFKSAASVKKK